MDLRREMLFRRMQRAENLTKMDWQTKTPLAEIPVGMSMDVTDNEIIIKGASGPISISFGEFFTAGTFTRENYASTAPAKGCVDVTGTLEEGGWPADETCAKTTLPRDAVRPEIDDLSDDLGAPNFTATEARKVKVTLRPIFCEGRPAMPMASVHSDADPWPGMPFDCPQWMKQTTEVNGVTVWASDDEGVILTDGVPTGGPTPKLQQT